MGDLDYDEDSDSYENPDKIYLEQQIQLTFNQPPIADRFLESIPEQLEALYQDEKKAYEDYQQSLMAIPLDNSSMWDEAEFYA